MVREILFSCNNHDSMLALLFSCSNWQFGCC
jgi:hypothetical protein